MHHLILGTAGHIDHGKTALVRALTGVDTDRLPEEKKRGITIDLGFAEIELGDYRLGVVDVPGHERFVRNMLAGASSMDIVMLVVAADDSVKPQTREHLDILRLLRRSLGLIVVTKCDLVEADWLDLVEADIRDSVGGTFLEDASLVRTSAKTGLGLPELKTELSRLAELACQAPSRRARQAGPFRLAVDRAFHVAGHGVVVTGSVAAGGVATGDTVTLEPDSVEVRVRGLQNHQREVEHVSCGMRAAVNLAGVRLESIHRGQELAQPGSLRPSKLLTVEVETSAEALWPIKDRSNVRFHAGSAEILAQLRLLGETRRLEPGERGFAQLFLRDPAACVWGQPFVLRLESPAATIGGGRVLHPAADKLREVGEEEQAMLQAAASDDPRRRAEASLFFAGLTGWSDSQLSALAGVDATATDWPSELEQSGVLCSLDLSPTRRLHVHRGVLERLATRVAKLLDRQHDQHPLATEIPREVVLAALDYVPAAVLAEVMDLGRRRKTWSKTARGWTLQGRGPKLTQTERKLLEWLVERFEQAGIESPTVEVLQGETTKGRQSIPQLVDLAVQQGRLVRIADGYVISPAADQTARDALHAVFQSEGELTVSRIREILQTSRKYAVPYCEYLDASGYTSRSGDRRRWAQPS